MKSKLPKTFKTHALKDLLFGTIQDILESKMNEHLGYSKYERSEMNEHLGYSKYERSEMRAANTGLVF